MALTAASSGWKWRPGDALLRAAPQCVVSDIIPTRRCPAGDGHINKTCLQVTSPAPHWDAAAGRCDCSHFNGNVSASSSGIPWYDPKREPNETYVRCGLNEWPKLVAGENATSPPPAYPRVTFVTGFFDLGRLTKDTELGGLRGTCAYLGYFAQWAQVEMNLAIFASTKTLELMGGIRDRFGLANRTQLHPIDSWADMPFGSLLPDIYVAGKASIYKHASSGFKTGSGEHIVPEYGLANHAKAGFLKLSIAANIFNSDYFFWVDAGAGHGSTLFRSPWCPCTWTVPHAITLVGDPAKVAENTEDRYFKDDGSFKYHYEDPVGAMWGGSTDAVLAFHDIYEELLRKMTSARLMDDDQPVLAMAYHRAASWIRLVAPGGWAYWFAC